MWSVSVPQTNTALPAGGVLSGLAHSSIDLMDASSGVLQKLANNPRKKAVGLLRAGNTYEAARLGEDANLSKYVMSKACASITCSRWFTLDK